MAWGYSLFNVFWWGQITGYGISNEKNCKFVIEVFNQSITNRKPFAYFSDNGKENTGEETKTFLEENGIFTIHTAPRNPQQNGKIEVFWKEVDKNIKNDLESNEKKWETIEKSIENFIFRYNNEIPHFGLEKTEEIHPRHKIPCEVYNDEDLITDDINDITITIDNNLVSFKKWLRIE